MKKALITMLVVVLILSTVSAFAAGKLRVEQENFMPVKDYNIYGYAYAKLQNVGDKPIQVNAGLLELYDENGDTLTSTDNLYAYCKYLQPDEYCYAYMYAKVEDAESTSVIDDYLLTITGKSGASTVNYRFPVEFEYKPQVTEGYYTYDYIYATVTNDTEEPVYNIGAVFTLLDDDDNILYMTNDYLDSNEALMPGSSLTWRKAIDTDFVEAYQALGLTATKADVIAYVDIDEDK